MRPLVVVITTIAVTFVMLDQPRMASAEPGIDWTSRSSAASNTWLSVAYGEGLFVAVAASGDGNRVMTSPDGVNWTSRESAADNQWTSVTYGEGLFVAVATTGSGNRVMTSPDGIDWTSRESAADNQWGSVTYGNGQFVAVAITGSGNRVMTSPDGINWTARSSAADNQWASVTYAEGLFVAVALTGSSNRVMTSPDGINWTSQASAMDNQWISVTHGNGLFVAVAPSGSGDRVMTSPDGINWTIRASAADNNWRSVTYGDGLFVAVAYTGTGNRVMTSPDGINWTLRASATDDQWRGVTYGEGLFVAVGNSGDHRVMTSGNPLEVLSVLREGSGSGTVSSVPAGIECGAGGDACERGFAPGTAVTLSAAAEPGSTLAGWSDACEGSGPCQVTMEGDRSVTVEFALVFPLSVSLTGEGSGTVTSTPAGINCGPLCVGLFLDPRVITLKAVPAANSIFTGFSGACAGTGPCQVTMSGARSVTAGFNRKPPARARFSLIILRPKKRVLKSGRKAKLKVRVTNSGDRAGTARVRINTNRKKLKVRKKIRIRVPAGQTVTRKVKVRSVRRKRGKVRVVAKLSGRKAVAVIRLRR